jgi:serine/threonine-protein kinase
MTPSPSSRQQFLTNLKKSGLLGAAEIESFVATLPGTDQGRELARALVRAGKLTRYQAELILAGRLRGLNIDPYRILKQRGKGGSGKVYKAVHTTMNRVVALKVMSPRWITTERARELFLREIVAVGRLVHPNIVSAYDASTTGDRCYLVMEYVNGPDLERLIQKHGPLRPAMACEIIRQAALGLQYAHELGMLHRDLKPANILIQPAQKDSGGNWSVKLVDFGLARLQTNTDSTTPGLGTILTKENTVMGTPDYLSPEQSRDLHKVDIRSDLYSLGCTFYFLLTGRVPYPGGTSLEKLIRHASDDPVPIDKIRPKVPAEVIRIVARLMAKRPEDRFQTPGELALALEPLATTASTSDLNLVTGGKKKRLPSSSSRAGAPRAKNLTESSGAKGGEKERADTETSPQARAATPHPDGETASPSRGPKVGSDEKVPYGLLIALGMVLFMMILALILSRL